MQPEHASGAENKGERAENQMERSVEQAWQKTMERERIGRLRSGNGAGASWISRSQPAPNISLHWSKVNEQGIVFLFAL